MTDIKRMIETIDKVDWLKSRRSIEIVCTISQQIYELLNDKSYYSLTLSYAAEQLQLPRSVLRKFADSNDIRKKFEQCTGDQLNMFKFNQVTYIGLETRRIQYEIDKVNGTNWVEKAIVAGEYD
jgi:hypothetical protein